MTQDPLSEPRRWLSVLPAAAEPTPLLDLRALAARLGLAQVLVKAEGGRPLGNFKSLGGVYAALRALARATGARDLSELLDGRGGRAPPLICASDGNHGLAVAEGARLAGGRACVYLPADLPSARIDRIRARGAEAILVDGAYDDAVEAARSRAMGGGGLLIPDTSDDPDDPVVADVMAGYDLMAEEIASQLSALHPMPTHLFVQAGVGGLAAAMAEGLARRLPHPPAVVVVEPARAACVAPALEARALVQLDGDLHTAAEMLSCGRASAPALRTLLRHGASAIDVDEAALLDAPVLLEAHGGPRSTPSGAAGLAGLAAAAADPPGRAGYGLDGESRVLLIASEGPVD
jgi:diaminopropionate ammonia-lyase